MADKIRKTKRKVNFTTVSNDFLQDVKLSWKAKGMIIYIMSLPPDWELNLSDLKNRSKDGRDSTAAGLRELIENGYCRRVRIRGERGIFGVYDYEVSDLREWDMEPQTDNPVMVDCPNTDNPEMEKPNTGKPTQVNTNTNNETLPINTQSNKPTNGIVGDLFPDEKGESKKKITTMFRNSDIYNLVVFAEDGTGDYSEFEKLFSTPEFNTIDLVYYFNAVLDWSETRIGIKRTKTGWISTVRNFIRGDAQKNKVHLKPEFQTGKPPLDVNGAMDYLKDY